MAMRPRSWRSAHDILKHYLARNTAMADNAIAKLIAWENERDLTADA